MRSAFFLTEHLPTNCPMGESIEDLPMSCQEYHEVEKLRILSAQTNQAEYKLLKRFFNQSLDLMCVAGLDGWFKHLNPAWTTFLGWTQEELKAKPFLDFVHPDDRVATLAEVGSLGKGVPTVDFQNRYCHKNGSHLWLQWNAQTVPGRQEIYATARDVTQEKRLKREILEIVDRERERLGRELHDGVCQTLAGIGAVCATLAKRLNKSPDLALSEAATEITELLRGAITETRDLARGFGPVGLEQIGLGAALQNMARNVQNLFRIDCTLACHDPFPKLSKEVEQHLFRIAQEAVSNAVTHGRPDGIEIYLRAKAVKGVLSVWDNGVGLGLPGKAGNPDGVGLHTMAYRAGLIGGALKVREHTHGQGTVVTCTFPLSESAETLENPDHVRPQTCAPSKEVDSHR